MSDQRKAQGLALRQAGNIHFGEQKYSLAFAKYSESIVQDPSCSETYGNRSAVLVKMEKFEMALNDVNKAVELANPSYKPKALFRKAVVLEKLGRLPQATNSLHQAQVLGTTNKALEKDITQTLSRLEKKLRVHEAEALQNHRIFPETTPDSVWKKDIEAEKAMRIQEASGKSLQEWGEAHLASYRLITAYNKWDKFYTMFRRVKRQLDEEGVDDGEPLWYKTFADANVDDPVYTLSNIFITGVESIYFLSPESDIGNALNTFTTFSKQVLHAVEGSVSVPETINIYKSRLATEDWTDVYISLACSVRVYFAQGVMQQILGHRYGTALQAFRHAAALLDAAELEWPASRFKKEPGSMLLPAESRAIRVFQMKCINAGYYSTKSKGAFSLEEARRLGEEVIESCVRHPTTTGGFHKLIYDIYTVADAYMELGLIAMTEGRENSLEIKSTSLPGMKWYRRNRELMTESAAFYRKAADLYPQDETKKAKCLWYSAEALLYRGYSTIEELEKIAEEATKIELFTHQIWTATERNLSKELVESIIEMVSEAKGNPGYTSLVLLPPALEILKGFNMGTDAPPAPAGDTHMDRANISGHVDLLKELMDGVAASGEREFRPLMSARGSGKYGPTLFQWERDDWR